jgi:hypothetical protein
MNFNLTIEQVYLYFQNIVTHRLIYIYKTIIFFESLFVYFNFYIKKDGMSFHCHM